jgi:hypothetical protein
VIDQCPISVTYCDIEDCVRVFTKEDGVDAVDLMVGGRDEDGMVVLLDGTLYAQMSSDVPLQDYPYALTTWGGWLRDHPESKVYVR